MKISFWLFLLCCQPLLCIAQTKRDSLHSGLRDAHLRQDSKEISYYQSHLGWYYLGQRSYDSALNYYRLVLSNPSTLDNIPLFASSLNSIGIIYSSTGYPDSSIYYYNKALEGYRQLQDTANVVLIEGNLSIIYKNKGLYDRALEYSFSALDKLEKLKPSRSLATCYNTIGSVYLNTEEHAKALVYYENALRVRREIGYERGIGQSYNNIGDTYTRVQLYDSALSYFLRALEVKQRIGDYAGITLNNIGQVLLHLGNASAATPYLLEALALSQNSDDPQGEVTILNNLGEVEMLLNRYGQAAEYLTRGGVIAVRIGGLESRRRNLELKVALYRLVGRPADALKYADQLLAVKDSLLNRETSEILTRLQLEYETEKREQQIELLHQEKELSNTRLQSTLLWNGLLVTGIAFVVIVLLLVYHQYKLSQRNEKHVDFLLEELHHRVKNNLQILSSVFSLQTAHLTDEGTIEVLKSSEGRVNAMALIHKMLYNEGKSREIDIRTYITELVHYLMRSYGFTEQNLSLQLAVDKTRLDVDKAIPLGLIVNELVSNSFKHAFDEEPNPSLTVEVKNDLSALLIRIQDNGKGIAVDKASTPSFGIKMVETLLKELKGQLSLNSQHGTTVILTIPLTS